MCAHISLVKVFVLFLILTPSLIFAQIPPTGELKITNNSNVPIVQLTGSLQVLNAADQFCLLSPHLNSSFNIPIMPQSTHVFSVEYGSIGICMIRDKFETLRLRIDSVNKQSFVDQIPCQISHAIDPQGSTLNYNGDEAILTFSNNKWTCTKL